jgi:glycosyltransferase involved in cell wall biosynthesis
VTAVTDRTVSFVIPTLNSEGYLRGCLDAIRAQDYPQERIEILICDGGSNDATRAIAAEYGCRLVENPRRTAEAGKAEGIRAAGGEIMAFIDSDNVIIGRDWLRRMVAPFEDPQICSSETLRWHYAREDGIVNRYAALSGINDPASLFVGNYGRWSWLTNRWTDYPVRQTPRDGYVRVQLDPTRVPTMGANGYLVRSALVRTVPGVDEYFFDIDAVQVLAQQGHPIIARVDTEIRHFFARDVRDFARKTRRRAQDYLHHRSVGERSYTWGIGGLVRFALATVLVFPLFIQVARGMRHRRDTAWLFHPVACWVTLAIYAEAVLRSAVKTRAYDRSGWHQ